MKRRDFIFLAQAILGFGLIASAFAEKSAIEEEVQLVEGVDCTQGKEIRRLEVHTRGAGCSLQYIKSGMSKEIAVSKRGVEICKDASKKVRQKLETSAYQCK